MDSKVISVWGLTLPSGWLNELQGEYLKSLPKDLPSLEWVWSEMNRVWREFGLDNSRPLYDQPALEFYSHPVWLMNGIYTAVDPVSVSHRKAIACYLRQFNPSSIADCGGGFGELARSITLSLPRVRVDIVEPYPMKVAVERLSDEERIQFVADLSSGGYDVVIAQDVLEHVESPIQFAAALASATKEQGILIFANCFHPVIDCHLPKTFHLRHTFSTVMKMLNLRPLGRVDGAPHGQVFAREGKIKSRRAYLAERISKTVGPLLNQAGTALSDLKRGVMR